MNANQSKKKIEWNSMKIENSPLVSIESTNIRRAAQCSWWFCFKNLPSDKNNIRITFKSCKTAYLVFLLHMLDPLITFYFQKVHKTTLNSRPEQRTTESKTRLQLIGQSIMTIKKHIEAFLFFGIWLIRSKNLRYAGISKHAYNFL